MQALYQEHFGLVRDPFNITPDPNFFYPSASHREALAQLIYGINARKGFVVLTGEVGTGKTTLIHALMQELNGNVQTALVFNIIENPTDLLRYLCDELGLTTPQKDKIKNRDYLAILNEFLLKTYKAGGNVSLIIDEAQNLSTEVLESIRLLSNFETSREKLTTEAGIPRKRSTGCRSTSTWEGRSTPCCTFSMRVSGTWCSSMSVSCRPRSPFEGWSTRG